MFNNGTKWLKADFHLHTRADKEFSYNGDDDRFIAEYVEKLHSEEIGLGIITNHNKFDLAEFKALKKRARKKDIIIYPGVELSVKEGANGIHCLLVFKEEDWINGHSESINQFLDEVFKRIENRENENTRCNKDLRGVVECLDSYNKDYFIIMAHIEQKSGFFNECNGGLIKSLSENDWFKEKIVGFQKGRTRDSMKQLEEWMGYKLPYIEGSDCKSIDEIGKGKKDSYVKIGYPSFDPLVLALKDFKNRISENELQYNHGYIKSVEFFGGKLSDKKIYLSPELNSLIGIRGSGKSSIIEAIRYALGMIPTKSDEEYKKGVVNNLLESGGKIILEIQDDFQKCYKVTKILGESSHVLDMEGNETGAKITSVIKAPLYFGQKDLSSMKSGYEYELLDKLVGEKTKSFSENIIDIENQLTDAINKLFELDEKSNKIPELRDNLKDTQHKIKIFEEKGVSKKLSKQVNFQKDEELINGILEQVDLYKKKLESIIDSDEIKEIKSKLHVQSKEVPDLFSELTKELSLVLKTEDNLSKIKEKISLSEGNIKSILEKLQSIKDSMEDEFAEIKREINIPNLNPDDFSKLKSDEDEIGKLIKEATEQDKNRESKSKIIRSLVNRRNELLLQEFDVYKEEISRINITQSSLKLSINFKGDKKNFKDKLKEFFKGTGISEISYDKMTVEYSDLVSILIDVLLDNSKILSGIITESQLTKVNDRIKEKFEELIRTKISNRIEIMYHGKPIIKHSIGQRASALVLFILSQKENNLIMIDQPEDDLDNQVIYDEIIKEIKIRKPEVQFVFATHNANIPVLGDSEQLIAVSYDEDQGIEVKTGSIDDKSIQNKVVDIMEGGPEAFNRRNEIYNLWKK